MSNVTLFSHKPL